MAEDAIAVAEKTTLNRTSSSAMVLFAKITKLHFWATPWKHQGQYKRFI